MPYTVTHHPSPTQNTHGALQRSLLSLFLKAGEPVRSLLLGVAPVLVLALQVTTRS